MPKGRSILHAMRLDEQPTILVAFLYGILDAGVFSETARSSYGLVGLGLLLISIAAFVLNEYANKELDSKRTDREPALLSGAVTTWFVLLFSASGLILGFVGKAPRCTAGVLILGLLYSMPPAHLKIRFGLDMVCLGSSFVILPYCAPYEILATGLQGAAPPAFHALNILTLLSFLAACNLIAMIRDIGPDGSAGIRNTTVTLGLERSLRLGILLTLMTGAIGTLVASERVFPWYGPVLVCTPLVACIFGFGLGAKADGHQIQVYFSSKAKVGIATGNVLATLLLLITSVIV